MGSDPVGRAEAQPRAQRTAVGGSRRFSSQDNEFVSPYLLREHVGTGEAVVTRRPSRGSAGEWVEVDGIEQLLSPSGVVLGQREVVSPAERERRSVSAAMSRAISLARRFSVRNGLTKLWTFTYASEQWDRAQVRRDVNRLMVEWRRLNGGRPFPYLYVIERHPGPVLDDGSRGPSHGLHVHVAVPGGLWTSWAGLTDAWGHGFAHYRAENKFIGQGKGRRERSRRLASYLTKYITKAFDGHQKGDRRYEVARGYEGEVRSRTFASFREVLDWLQHFGLEQYELVWSDYEAEDWLGPPTWIYRSG